MSNFLRQNGLILNNCTWVLFFTFRIESHRTRRLLFSCLSRVACSYMAGHQYLPFKVENNVIGRNGYKMLK